MTRDSLDRKIGLVEADLEHVRDNSNGLSLFAVARAGMRVYETSVLERPRQVRLLTGKHKVLPDRHVLHDGLQLGHIDCTALGGRGLLSRRVLRC